MGCFHTYNGKHYKSEAEVKRVIARELYQEFNALTELEYGTEEHLESFKEFVNSKFTNIQKPAGREVAPGVYVNQEGLTKEEQLELFDFVRPILERQGGKTNQGKNAPIMVGLERRWDYVKNNPGKKKLKLNPMVSNPKYGYFMESINGEPLEAMTDRFKELISKASGVDVSQYNGAIINLYGTESFISSHNDVDEDVSAESYPVVVVNIGGTGNVVLERIKEAGTYNLDAGAAYIFGLEGKNRRVWHRTMPGESKGFLPAINIEPAKQSYNAGEYRISLTLRRVTALEEGMPKVPAMVSYKDVTSETPRVPDGAEVDFSKKWKGDLESRPVYTDEGVNIMRTNAVKDHRHFGNPFSEKGYGDTFKVDSIAKAADMYTAWVNDDKTTKDFGIDPLDYARAILRSIGAKAASKGMFSLEGQHYYVPGIYTLEKKVDGKFAGLEAFVSVEGYDISLGFKPKGENTYKANSEYAITDFKLKQAVWVQNQIARGKLDGKTLLYPDELIKRTGRFHGEGLIKAVETRKIEQAKLVAPEIIPTEINAATEKIIGKYLAEDDNAFVKQLNKNPIKRNAETKFLVVGEGKVAMVQASKVAEIDGFNFYVYRGKNGYQAFEESTGLEFGTEYKTVKQAEEGIVNFISNKENWVQTILNTYKNGTAVTKLRDEVAAYSAVVEETVEVPKGNPEILDDLFKRVPGPVTATLYRTEGTNMKTLGTAFRGTGTYYAIDKPFITGTKGEKVTKVQVNIPEETTLDITSYQETGFPTSHSIAYDRIYKEAMERTKAVKKQTLNTLPDMIKNVALERGYTGVISYIEPGAPTVEAMKEEGREYVEYGQVRYGETSIIKKLYEVLPKGIAVDLVDDYIKVFNDGDVAVGVFKEGMIRLSKHASDKHAFHEAFHAIFMTVLSPEQREAMYKEAEDVLGIAPNYKVLKIMAERNLDYNKARELFYHEELADEFVEYRENPRTYRFNNKKGIKAFFERILKWLKSVFTNTYTVDQIFNRINRGKYVNSKVNIYTDMAFYKRHPEFSQDQVESITNQMAFFLIKDFNIVNLRKEGKVKVEDLVDFEQIDRLIEGLHTRAENEGDFEMINRAKKVYKNRKFFKSEVKKFIKSFGILSEEDVIDEDGNLVPVNKLTLDDFDQATASTRLLIALTPQYVYYNSPKDRQYDVTNSYLGMPMFVNMTDTWNFINRNFQNIYSFDPDVDTFQAMVDKLRELQDVRPEMGSIADRIEASGVKAQTQFQMSLTNHNTNYITTLVKRNYSDNSVKIRVVSSEVESDPKVIANQWNEELLEKSTVESKDIPGSYIYRQDYAESIARGLKRFESLFNADMTENKEENNPIKQETLEMLDLLLNAMGININPRALKLALKDQGKKNDIRALHKLLYDKEYGIMKGITDLTKLGGQFVPKFESSEDATVDQTVILDQKAFAKLAEYEAMFATDSAKVTHVGPDGAVYYGFAKHTAKAKMVEKYNKDHGNLDGILTKPFGTNSIWAKWRKKSGAHNFKLHVPLTYKEEGAKDKGESISKLNPINSYINSINTHLHGYYQGLAEADKKNQYWLSGPPLVEARLSYNGDKTDTTFEREDFELVGYDQNKVVDIFIGYLADELARMRSVHEDIYGSSDMFEPKSPLPDEELIAFYHYAKTPRDGKGKGLKNHLFPNMDMKKYGLLDDMGKVKSTFTKEDLYNNKGLREYVYNTLVDLIFADVQKAQDFGILTSASKGSISTEILDKKEYAGAPALHAMADYTINSMIGSIEDTKLFVGDPAAYEEKRGNIYADITKRVPVTSLQGNSARVYKNKNGDWEVRPYYWSATLEDVEKPSSYFMNKNGNLSATVVDNVYRALATINGKKVMTKKEVARILSAYVEDINIIDATAYITMDARRERSKAFGHWEESTDQEIYDRITNNELLPEDLTWMLSPMKLGHGELVTRKNSIIQHYNKQAEFVLHPYLTKGTKLENLRIAMENQGVDHVLFISGKKSGATGVTKIVDENNELLPADQIKLNKHKLSYYSLIEQLPSSEKGIKPTNVGTQMRKTVKVNVSMEEDYMLNGEPIKGADLLQLHEDVISKLSTKGLQKLLDKIKYSPSQGFKYINPATGNFIINNSSREFLYDMLIEEFEGEVSDNVIEALEKRLPLDSIVSMRTKIQNKLASLVNKASVKLKQRGAALVQMPDFGLTGVNVSTQELHKSVLWFKDPAEELKMAQLNKVGDKLTYDRSQVLVSMDFVRNIPGWQNMDGEQIKAAIDPELMQGLMYRIPTQGSSSLDSFDIVGILPESMGDVMISYSEITAKTGSDFDIDKVYVMYYNFKPTYKNKELFFRVAKEFDLTEADYVYKKKKQDIISSSEYEERVVTASANNAQRLYDLAKETEEKSRTRMQQALIERVDELRDEYFDKLVKIKYNPENETKAGLENYSLDIMKALIEDKKSYLQTVAALDNKWLPDYANEMFPEKTDLAPGQFWTGSHQTYLKNLYDAAKDLVGVIANHSADHGPAQVAELYFNNAKLGRGNVNELGYTSLSGITNENKMFISGILGDFMNGIVDAAKDNYITRANINSFTAGVAFALARAGVHEKFVVAFTGQPILADLVLESHIENSDLLGTDLYDKGGKMRNKYTRAANRYIKDISNIEDYSGKFFDLSDITLEQLENQIKNPTPDFQVSLLKLFKKIKESYAAPLNESIRGSKYDTEGLGKNLTSARVMINLMTKTLNDNLIGNLHRKYGIEVDDKNMIVYKKDGFPKATKKTFISTMYNNSARQALKIFSELFMTESNAFKEVVDIIANIQNPDIKLDADAIDSLKKELFAYVASHEQANFLPTGENASEVIRGMFFGDNTTAKKLASRKRAGGKVAENLVIQKFTYELGKSEQAPDLVRLNRAKKLSIETEKNLFIAMEELFVLDPDFATELAQMAYLSSGFMNNFGSFFDVVPSGYLSDIGFTSFIERAMTSYRYSGLLLTSIRQIMQHTPANTESSVIIPKVFFQDTLPVYTNDFVSSDKAMVFTLNAENKYDLERYVLGENEDGQVEFIRYVQSMNGKTLYELIGYHNNLPIYKAIPKLGYSKRGRVVKEYRYDTRQHSSMFAENNVNLDVENDSIVKKIELRVEQENENYRPALPVKTYGKNYHVQPVITQEQIDEAKKTCE